LAAGYSCLLLADHGNAEDKSPKTMTSHTTNPVPVILVTADPSLKKRRFAKGAGLKDVAPAILDILGQKNPQRDGEEYSLDIKLFCDIVILLVSASSFKRERRSG
jgi:bisphosphoglycerate-independent phosphoglycerate mutase (AlkP superfamily)